MIDDNDDESADIEPARYRSPEAARVRAEADQHAIAYYCGGWPGADQIEARGSHFDPDSFIGALPREPAARLDALRAKRDSHADQLGMDCTRYEHIRTRGIAVISDSDLTIAYGGDALLACRGSLQLKTAHISLDRSVLAALDAKFEACMREIERDRLRLALF